VDRILDYEPGKWIRGVKNITITDPIFLGHFPGKAIFPGVLIVEAMAQTGGCLVLKGLPEKKNILIYFMSIDKAKFRKPVVPGDQMVMHLEIISLKGRICKLRGVAMVDGQKVAEAELMSMMVDVEKGEAQ
jgi:beta-hydroxyacyl-ACP dehydratase FabZ